MARGRLDENLEMIPDQDGLGSTSSVLIWNRSSTLSPSKLSDYVWVGDVTMIGTTYIYSEGAIGFSGGQIQSLISKRGSHRLHLSPSIGSYKGKATL